MVFLMVQNIFLDGLQNCLVYQPLSSYFTSKNGRIGSCQSKRMSEQNVKPSTTTDISFDVEIAYKYGHGRVKFKRICLKQDIIVYMVNLYIAYELDKWWRYLNTNFTLGNCLFGIAKLTRNADPHKYWYNDYDIGFIARSQFTWSNGNWVKLLLFFGVDNSSYTHFDNKKRYLG